MYERVTVERVRSLYHSLNVEPTFGIYQVWFDESLVKADPLGLIFYLLEGEVDRDTDYTEMALVMDLPYEYVLGFDIAYEGDLVLDAIGAAEIDIDPASTDLWLGAFDGQDCRQALSEEEVA